MLLSVYLNDKVQYLFYPFDEWLEEVLKTTYTCLYTNIMYTSKLRLNWTLSCIELCTDINQSA